MAQLKPDLVLMCAENLALRLVSRSGVEITVGESVYSGSSDTLVILHAFRQPTTLRDALRRLTPFVTGKLSWIDLTTQIATLYRMGVLIDQSQTQPHISERMHYFGSPPIHIDMLNDRPRTVAYLDAIREVVRPGDVVVDLGTGTGVLAIGAAQAGASRVYAIEASDIADAAQANFDANGLSDRITLIREWSKYVELPEKADVLVSEIIGNEPLGERLLEYTRDAVERFLKPDARLIPDRIRIYALPVSLPQSEVERLFFSDAHFENWRAWYGIDFGALKAITAPAPFLLFVKSHEPRDWHQFSDPVLLDDIDLRHVSASLVECSVTFTTQRAGRLDGVLIYPDADLSPGVTLTRFPGQVDSSNSWRSPVWVLPRPYPVSPGDQFAITYRYGKTRERFHFSLTPL